MSGKLNWEKRNKLDKLYKQEPKETPDWQLEALHAKAVFFEGLRVQRMLKKRRKEVI